MADGCVGDENGNLVFISRSGRATPPFRSFGPTLGRDEQGLDQFHVITDQARASRFRRQRREPGEAHHPRLRRTLFGSLTNWLFDRRCVKPDKANASALALCRAIPPTGSTGCGRWCGTPAHCRCSIHWRDTVLDLLQARRMLTRLPLCPRVLEGHRLAIDVRR